MTQISIPKENVAVVIAKIEADGCKIIRSHIAENKKEVILYYTEPVKTPVNTPEGPVIETNATPDAPAMNKVIPPNITNPLVTEII